MTESRSKTVVIIALCLTLIFMGVGFAGLSKELKITTTGTVASEDAWDIRLTGFTANATGNSTGTIDAEGTALVASFSLARPGDSVTYTGKIKNFGTIDAQLEGITNGETPKVVNDYITRTITTVPTIGDDLLSTKDTDVVITYTFNSSTTALPENAEPVTDIISFNYIQK